MPSRKSLYDEYPDYRVDLDREPRRHRVRLGDQLIADSDRALMVRETRHAPVVYFPRDDVRMDLLERSERVTFCPFKGEASYYSIRTSNGLEVDVVWSYEDPFEQVAELEGHLAFYPDRTDLEVVG